MDDFQRGVIQGFKLANRLKTPPTSKNLDIRMVTISEKKKSCRQIMDDFDPLSQSSVFSRSSFSGGSSTCTVKVQLWENIYQPLTSPEKSVSTNSLADIFDTPTSDKNVVPLRLATIPEVVYSQTLEDSWTQEMESCPAPTFSLSQKHDVGMTQNYSSSDSEESFSKKK